MIGLILDGHVTKMGFRVRKGDETWKNGMARQRIGPKNVYVANDKNLLIVRGPCTKPNIFDKNALPAYPFIVSHIVRA